MVKAAWVYLTQNTRSDESYSVDRRGPLERSLELLQKNSLDANPRPVIIFHEGDFQYADQNYFTNQWPLVQFRQIRFEMPDFLKDDDIPVKWGGKFSIGYRHMIRFYSSLIYPLLWDEFDYYARMDDDSYLLSPMNYDLFDHMEANNLDYTYRVDCQDHYHVSQGFSEVIRGYLAATDYKPGELWRRNIEPTNSATFHANPRNAWPPPPPVKNPRRMMAGRKKAAASRVFYEWNRWGYYNNFHGTRLSFWRRPEVQDFLRFLDRTGGGYKYRWNDLIVQSAAVQIFADPQRVAKLTDWDYEHRTNTPDGKLIWGGRYCQDPKQTVRCHNTK